MRYGVRCGAARYDVVCGAARCDVVRRSALRCGSYVCDAVRMVRGGRLDADLLFRILLGAVLLSTRPPASTRAVHAAGNEEPTAAYLSLQKPK